MKYLFSTSGLRVLNGFLMTSPLLAFDFDGTLVSIVQNPAKVHLDARVRQLLKDLSLYAPIAVISGRSQSDLRRFLPVEITCLVGNHGLEGLGSFQSKLEVVREVIEHWETKLQGLQRLQGVWIENKDFSLAVHFRQSRYKKNARSSILERVSGLSPSPRVVLGKSVVNLVPAGAPHKGVAVLEILVQLQKYSVIYIGDDETDEDIFSLPDSRILKIRVGRKEKSQAEYFLKNQREITKLLNFMKDRIFKYASKTSS